MDELKKLEADLAGMCAELAELEEENETQRKKLRDLEIKMRIESFRMDSLENLMRTSEDPFGDEFEQHRLQWEHLNEKITGPTGFCFSASELKGACRDRDYRMQQLECSIEETKRRIKQIRERGR